MNIVIILWQYYKDHPNDNITQSESVKSKIKNTGKTPTAGNTKDVEIIVPLTYLSNFWGTLEMALINCEVNAKDNAKLLQQLKSGFKRTINWNKYESNIKTFAQNRYLNHLINPSFHGVNRLFVLSFENDDDRTSHSTYYLPKVEIRDYNIMIDGKNSFDQPINSMTKTYKNIRKIATGQGDDCTTGCL